MTKKTPRSHCWDSNEADKLRKPRHLATIFCSKRVVGSTVKGRQGSSLELQEIKILFSSSAFCRFIWVTLTCWEARTSRVHSRRTGPGVKAGMPGERSYKVASTGHWSGKGEPTHMQQVCAWHTLLFYTGVLSLFSSCLPFHFTLKRQGHSVLARITNGESDYFGGTTTIL